MRQNAATVLKIIFFLIMALSTYGGTAHARSSKPKIIVIWGDDIGQSNISAYSKGVMGYRTPNIDRLAVSNEMMSHLDWMPTLLAAAGDPDVKDKLLKGHKVGNATYKVHLDGYNFLPHMSGKEPKSPRESFFYFSDDGDLTALRYDNWKLVFMEQRQRGTLQVWFEPYTLLRAPKLFNLRTDPYERADVTSNTYWDWYLDHAFLMVPAQAYVANFLATFQDYPPRQKPASFSLAGVLEKLQENPGSR